jgi:pyruvate/2-oxoacid:ferredoxin oxidoreductase beta subunit
MLQDRRLAIAVVSRDMKLANAVIEEAERRGVKAIHVIDPCPDTSVG